LWLLRVHQSIDRTAVVLPQLRQEVGELPLTGLVAEIGEWHPPVKQSRRLPLKIILLAIITASCIIVPTAATLLPLTAPIPTGDEPTPPTGNEPGRHLITLNMTMRAEIPGGTYYMFEDFANFTQVRSQYGATLGLLIFNCSGAPGVITLRENNSKIIDSFFWKGQALIAVGSWHSESWFRGNKTSESWGWMENAAMDWLAGRWSPGAGIFVEHQPNQSLGTAQLDILYFVPQPIPEFALLYPIITITALIVIVGRRRARQS
jgi:hypothetical protein